MSRPMTIDLSFIVPLQVGVGEHQSLGNVLGAVVFEPVVAEVEDL